VKKTQTLPLLAQANPLPNQWITRWLPNWANLYAGAALFLLPFLAMSHTLGRVGFVLDDWFIWKEVRAGRWFNYDVSRPLGTYPVAITHLLAGDNLSAIFTWQIIYNGLAGVLFFMVARRLLQPLVRPSQAYFAGLAAALAFVIYPSDASRYWLIASVGTRFVTIELLAAILCWLAAAKRNDPRWLIGAFAFALLNVMRVETALLILAGLPFLLVLYGHNLLKNRWFFPIVGWYLLLGAYALWRFRLLGPTWRVGHLGLSPINVHPFNALTPLQLVNSTRLSLQEMTITTLAATAEEHQQALSAGGADSLPLIAVLACALLLAGAWLFSRQVRGSTPPPPPPLLGFATLLFALGAMVGGMLPYIVNSAFPARLVATWNITSRSTAVPSIGLCLLLAIIPLLISFYRPEFGSAGGALTLRVKRLQGWFNLLLIAALAVLASSTGLVRLVNAGENYARAWAIQESYWQRLLEMPRLWERDTVYLLYDFPVYVGQAPLANQSWAFRAGVAMFLTPAPENIQFYPDNAGELSDWRVEDDQFSFRWLNQPERRSVPLVNLRVLAYDRRSGMLALQSEFPASLLPPNSPTVSLYTGRNAILNLPQITPLARQLLSPWPEPPQCQTVIPVRSVGAAARAGVVLARLVPEGVVLDRRAVAAGDSLHYAFYAPCQRRINLQWQEADGVLTDLNATYQSGEGENSPALEGVWR
jgi:hypothetical protein